jgi:hypothetical protein
MNVQPITPALVDAYMTRDAILAALNAARMPADEQLTCQRWLRESPAKRLIFESLYGDLLGGPRRKVLDIGGGLTSLTRLLASRHDYTLIDIMAHDSPPLVATFVQSTPSARFITEDWYTADMEDDYDVVVTNDLFPNVDQRLGLFLRAALPRAREVRLALTYYNEPKFYFTKRVDADEVLCMLAWDGLMTRNCIEKHLAYTEPGAFDVLQGSGESPFANRRQVSLVRLRGTPKVGGRSE